MTIADANKFYDQDKEKYIVSKNKELLMWLKQSTKNGYHPLTDIDDMQELINNLVYWYEFKYPERELAFYDGIINYNFEDVRSLSRHMDIEQLKFRLPDNQLALIECNYHSGGGWISNIYNNGEIIGYEEVLAIPIKKKNFNRNNFNEVSEFLICADVDGNVNTDFNINNLVKTSNITLDDLLIILNYKYANDYDFTNLENCVYNHDCNIKLRNMILQLTALKLLYSRNTIPERGYERAKRFINEFNKKLNLNLTTIEIDDAINIECNKDKSSGKVKNLVRNLANTKKN